MIAIRNAVLISLFYCLFGFAWIGFANNILLNDREIVSNQSMNVELVAESVFVIYSSALIFFLMYFFNKRHDLSLKKQYDEQQALLEKSEKLYRAVIENTEDIIALVDKDGNILYANAALGKLTGFTLAEMKGKPAFGLMHPENVEESKAALKKNLDNPGVSFARNNRFLDKNTGEYIWVQGTIINLLHDENIGAIIANYKDVTEKKLSEQKAAFDHNNLKALINNTNDLMWSVDTDFKLITSNKAFDAMVLAMSGGIIGKGDNVLETNFSEEQVNRFKVRYERAFAGETFTEIEHSSYPVSYWSEISFYPIFNAGEIVGTACFAKDITERHISEIKLSKFTNELIDIKNKLERNEFKLKQAQAIAHVGSWELDFASGMALWSEESCRIYGLPTDENIQSYESWKSFIHPEDLKNVLKTMKKSYDTLSPPYFHHRIIRKDGSVRYIYSKTQFEFNAAGEPIGLCGIAHDVTEQKLAEQEILQKNNELRALSNHLQRIREDERKSIAREIHDELGQQLTVLKMDISWVARKLTDQDPAVALKLQEILDFSDGLIKTIRRILSDLRPPIIDDLGLIASLEWICSDFEGKTKIPCEFISNVRERKFENNFSITAYRILQESLTNIMRHAQAKRVTVCANETEKEILLEIADDGKGICTESIKKGKTLGVLGMKERAHLFGGKLIITGAANKGTTVKLTLPLKNEHVIV